MGFQIDDAFIGKWEPEYDDPQVGGDYAGYRSLVSTVAQELASSGTISKNTFREIWKWKGAIRVIRHTTIYLEGYVTKACTQAEDEYYTRYAPAFRRAASEPPERKLAALLGNGSKLPGVEAPTASTIAHFMDPDRMPIIDVRTVEALVEAGYISTKQRDLEHYEEYRRAIYKIKHDCPARSLRQIDRALFAYHKKVLDKKAHHSKRPCGA